MSLLREATRPTSTPRPAASYVMVALVGGMAMALIVAIWMVLLATIVLWLVEEVGLARILIVSVTVGAFWGLWEASR